MLHGIGASLHTYICVLIPVGSLYASDLAFPKRTSMRVAWLDFVRGETDNFSSTIDAFPSASDHHLPPNHG